MKNVWCLWSKTDPQGLICCLYFKAFMSDLSMRKITFIDHHLLIKLFVFSLLCFLNDYSWDLSSTDCMSDTVICFISFDSQITLWSSTPFYRWGDWGSLRLSSSCSRSPHLKGWRRPSSRASCHGLHCHCPCILMSEVSVTSTARKHLCILCSYKEGFKNRNRELWLIKRLALYLAHSGCSRKN